MKRSRAAFFLLIVVVLVALSCAPGEVEEAEAPAAVSAAAGEESASASLAWPPELFAQGTTSQATIAPPPPYPPPLPPVVVPSAEPSRILYDWANKRMSTHYEPGCPALMTGAGGSEDSPCSYYFEDGDVYYVYQDQKMTEADPTDDVGCCIVEDFSMLSMHFPEYVNQYGKHMTGLGATCTPSQIPTDLPPGTVTLGTPGAGFYAYDSEAILWHGDKSWVKPVGFGGTTPNAAFTSLIYSQAATTAAPTAVDAFALPAVCQGGDVPACPNYKSDDECDGLGLCEDGCDLSCVFGTLESPAVGGCILCHNPYDDAVFPLECNEENEFCMAQFSASSCGGESADDPAAVAHRRSW